MEELIPFLLENVDVILKKEGSVVVHKQSNAFLINGLNWRQVAWMISMIDGSRTTEEIRRQSMGLFDDLNMTDFFLEVEGLLVGFKTRSGRNVKVGDKVSHKNTYLKKPDPISTSDSQTEIKHIGILGGGTAGYLTALALRKKRPGIKVSLIESSRIPVIGVGEATTPLIVDFLHRYLDFELSTFYRAVNPTWKLGIKFIWGLPKPYSFINPFGTSDLLNAELHDQNLNESTIESTLIHYEKGMILQESENVGFRSVMDRVGYAYHLDNQRLINFLREHLHSAGVEVLDRTIKRSDLDADTGQISTIWTERGEAMKFDMYVDCSGFSSFLLGKTLNVPFHSYRKSLFTDRAITGVLDNQEGQISPYTLAQTMQHGWNWSIPLRYEDHRGYVFSSAFCTDDQAWDEMKAINPGLHNPRVLKFQSGRRSDFWIKNVVGIGNSYAFVEPLESTGIHMIIEEIKLLVEHLPAKLSDQGIRKIVNDKINLQWDYLRWYLALHFKYNRSISSAFWDVCNHETDVSGIQELIDLHTEEGPLYLRYNVSPQLLRPFFHDSVFGPYGFDYILLGQKVPFRNAHPPLESAEEWSQRKNSYRNICSRATDVRTALDVIEKHPELLKL